MQDYVKHSGDLLDFMQTFFISMDVVLKNTSRLPGVAMTSKCLPLVQHLFPLFIAPILYQSLQCFIFYLNIYLSSNVLFEHSYRCFHNGRVFYLLLVDRG